MGFPGGQPIVYDGTEPVAIDAQAGKGKLARFLGVNLVSPRTAHIYRQGGINFLEVFQNAGAQIEARYGREAARLWKKAVAHTLYRGLPDGETLRDIEHRSGKTSVMVHGFNVNNNQVNGSGDNLAEQARPLLQVEDIRIATGGETALLDARDAGFFTVEMPEFWHRPEMTGLLRDVTQKADKYAWLANAPRTLSASSRPAPPEADDSDDIALATILRARTASPERN